MASEKSPSSRGSIWDVAVVGGGPAGATAALHLASRGHSVLIVDKESFPRDKVCGDALIPDSIRALRRAGLYEEVSRAGHKLSVGSVYSPSQFKFDLSGEFITLKRYVFDCMILTKAQESGAVFQKGQVKEVQPLPDGTVSLRMEGSDEPARCRIAMIATGANVDLARKLGAITQPKPTAIALRCYIRSTLALDRLIISYDRSITPGYAWIFPLGGGEFNVGCGMVFKGESRPEVNLRHSFASFVREFPEASRLVDQAESVMPLKGAMLRCGLTGTRPLVSGSILALGETIGATFPFTGEGIGKAMETGEVAAELSHAALASGDFDLLRGYPARLDRELKPKYLGYQKAEDWFSRPWLNDLVSRRIRRSPYMQRSLEGIVNETIDPREMFSLKGLLKSIMG